MKTVYKSGPQDVAHVEAFVGDEYQEFVDVEIPFNYYRLTVGETLDLIDNLCEALRAIAKSH